MKHKKFLLNLFKKGFYSCDELGNVYSHIWNPNIKKTDRYCYKLKGSSKNKTWYALYRLTNPETSESHSFNGHTIVYLFFNRSADFNKKCINHIDGVKHNNKLNNLELVSQKDNIKHSIEFGLGNPWKRKTIKLSPKIVKEIKYHFKKYQCREGLAEKYGVDRTTINRVIRGQSWSTNPEVKNGN